MPHFEDLFLAGGITLLLVTVRRLNSLGDALGGLFSGMRNKDSKQP